MKNNILALETSTDLHSIALFHKKKIHTKYIFSKNKNKQIIPLIKDFLIFNHININKINKILINKGPGSNLNIRITYLISKVIKIKFNKIKIIKMSTFDIIMKNLKNLKKKIYILIKKNTQEIFKYNIKKKKNKIITLNLIKKKFISQKHKKTLFITNNYQLKKIILKIIKKPINIKVCYPKAKYMIKLFCSL